MPQKNAQDRLWKILTPVLLVLAVLAMAKTLFVGLEIDEEYAFSLGFRLVKGDRLFYTMWEPHQLSALPAALVLALYWGATLLYLPATILTILAFGFWLPVTIALMIVYPGLEKVFKLEETINARRAAEIEERMAQNQPKFDQ
jgi:hypothetical protein